MSASFMAAEGGASTTMERRADALVFVLAAVFALFIRYAFRDFSTSDFTEYTGIWYAAVQAQGLAAAGTSISNYTPPYLYLLYLTSLALPKLAPIMAIKIPSVAFDCACAFFVYRIVALKYPGGREPLFASLAVLLAPSVICNSSLWGQADSIYTAMLLACLYFLMSGRAAFAMAAFGLAFSIKFQTMFLAPALVALWSRRVIPLWSFFLVPAVYVLAMMPAWLVGRPASELATVYLTQSATYHSLTKSAPNVYAWLPERYYSVAVIAGLAVMVVVACFYVWSVWRSRVVMSREIILQLCLLSLIMTPFFLPKMHERFFYPADVVAIAYGFYFPKQYYVPVAIGFASFFSYLFFLLHRTILPLQLRSLVMFVALAAVAWGVRKSLNMPQAAAAAAAESRSAIC
jgi:Gpi18-like mannosyltransferase